MTEHCEKIDATTRELRRDAANAWDRFERSAGAWMERVSTKLADVTRSGRHRARDLAREVPRRAHELGAGAWRLFTRAEHAIDRRTRKLAL